MFKHIFAALFAVIFGHGRRHHGGGHCGALIAAAAILTGSTAHACCTSTAAVTHVSTACTQAVRTTFVQPMQVVMQAVPVAVQQVMVVQPRFVAAAPVCTCATAQTVVQAPAIAQSVVVPPAPVPGPQSFTGPPAPPVAAPSVGVQTEAVQMEAVAVEARKLTLFERLAALRTERRALKQEVVLVPAPQVVATETTTIRTRSRLRCF